ncbi:hypothetical protein pb186bvf_003158 [Paramecium bursaria]
MQNQNAYLDCTKHPNQRVSSLNFDEYISENSRLLCSLCQIDLLNKNQKKNYSLVDIDEFLKDPIIQVQRVMKYDGSKAFSDLDYLQQFEKEITLIEMKFQLTIDGLKTCVEQIRNLKDKFQQDFQSFSKLNNLIESYDKARYIQENELKQKFVNFFEQHLNLVCQNLNQAKYQASQNMIRSQEDTTIMFRNYLQTLIQDINRLQEVSITTFNLNNIQGLPILIYGELKNFPQIHYKISEGKAIQYQLLYLGSNEGLNLKQYYSKCQNQSHLLTIIKTKNGSKFGGYSPCSFQNNQVDPQLKSFLFQYNKQEIYNIKNQKTVCHMEQQNCQFGDGDLSFNNNFTNFSSNLGMSYDIRNYNVQDRRTYILENQTHKLPKSRSTRQYFNDQIFKHQYYIIFLSIKFVCIFLNTFIFLLTYFYQQLK